MKKVLILTLIPLILSVSGCKEKEVKKPSKFTAFLVREIDYLLLKVSLTYPSYKGFKKLGAKVLFVGDDWYGTDKWKEYEKRFNEEGIRIVYFPYTKGISSTKITQALQQVRGWTNESAQKMFHLNLENSEDDR